MSLLQEVFTNLVATLLGNLSNSFISKIWNCNENFNALRETLHEKLKGLQGTLQRIHAQQARVSCTQIPSDWLDELVWCHYEIEDTIDSINLAVSKQSLTTKVLQTHLERIRNLQNKLEEIETKLSNRQANPDQESIGQRNVSPALESLRAKEKEAIIRKLKSHPLGVSILGLGGIGKTKLAEAVVDDGSIEEHFNCVLSPPLSPEFNLKILLGCINDTIRGEKKRVLIQLDGLQSVTPEDWHQFHSHCQENLHMTIKFLITTQNPRVADVTGCVKYVLSSLSAEECFSLIYHRAEANKNLYEDDVQAIKHNENELVEKCKGLPLLANHIGLLLSAEAPGNRDKIVRTITTSSMWKQSGLGRVLQNLSPVSMLAQKQHLQRCVAYCSLFPPEHDFRMQNLVQLWMVEGFTQLMSTTEDIGFLEQAASECFDDLLSHSIFQTLEFQPDEDPRYKMHQLLYDLGQNIGSKTFCRIHEGNSDFSLSLYIRHLSLSCENIENHEQAIPQLLNDIKSCNGLRTFLLLHCAGRKISQNPTFFETLERLRVLDLSHTNLTKLSHISKLKHLRYLDLSHTPIKKLSSLSKHRALLVLKLNDCDLLQCLPNDLTELTNLLSLQVNVKGLGAMPQRIGNLSKLQSLNVFIVGKDEGYKIAELKHMNHLGETLCITKLENVKTKSKAEEAMLHNKNRLERLELQWTCSTSNESAKQVLEGLIPPKNLKELTIRKYSGSEFPHWLSSTEVCGMLKTIHLAHFEACKVLPSLGKLPMLKTLHLEAMFEIRRLGHEFFKGGFLCLESLKICDLPNLTEWTLLAVDSFPRLRELQIVNSQRLVKLPPMDHLASLESVEIHECAQLEELPTLSTSIESLIITESDILRQRCQVGHPDWHKIRGINVVIDSERVDTGEQLSSTPDREAVVHQSNCIQIEGSAVNETDSGDHLTEHHAHSIPMDVSESLCQQVIGQLPITMDALDSHTMQVGEEHPSACLRVIYNQESDILQEGSWQHQIPKSQNEIQRAKRMRRSKA